ncbi:MAG: hypothetical protein HYV77_01815 [Candidatus Wildermuthbacteria bacterium]|nr:hypothetical protein [Candidatus Wildermuthbacteria bacterium]
MTTQLSDMQSFIKRVEEIKKSGTADLSLDEDLSIAVMNLISLEEHFFFTGVKTEKDGYFDLLCRVRNIRKEMLAKLVDKHEGETWCVSKHLLAATMRLIEVGTKLQSLGKKDEAKEIFSRAYETYSLFWALKLNLADIAELKKAGKEEKPWTLKDIVTKLVDCCDES